MNGVYLIGDVHGCYKTLMALVDKLPSDAKLCFVGDLIDRGPMSKQVIDFVKDNNHDCVIGNHEDMMLAAFRSGYPLMDVNWIENGGNTTISSYNRDMDKIIEHIEYLKNLPTYIEYPDIKTEDNKRHLVVSHSSIGKIWKKRDETKDDTIRLHAIWNRDISHGTLPSSNDIYNVFGHTVQKQPMITDFFACIDTGCCYPSKGYHKLTALHFPSLEVITQENID